MGQDAEEKKKEKKTKEDAKHTKANFVGGRRVEGKLSRSGF